MCYEIYIGQITEGPTESSYFSPSFRKRTIFGKETIENQGGWSKTFSILILDLAFFNLSRALGNVIC